MPEFIVKSCCFCLPMRTGMMVLGILSLISGISWAVTSIVRLPTGDLIGYWASSVVIGIISSVMAVLLLIGVFKDKPVFLTAYYSWLAADTVATAGLSIYLIVELSKADAPVLETAAVVVMLITIFTNIYFIFMVKKYARMVRKKLTASGISENQIKI